MSVILIKMFWLGFFYFFILCFIIFLFILRTAPEYIEKEDGTLVRIEKKKSKEAGSKSLNS